MPDKRPKRTEKLQLMLSDEELEAIDNWRFANRIPTRAAALRELLRRGLMSGEDVETPRNAATGDYGVINSGD